MFLLHLLRLLLMFLFHLLWSRSIVALLRPLMFFLLLLLQFLVFLILLLSELLLLLLVFLIRVRFHLWRAVLWDLARMVVSGPIVCLRPVARIWWPIRIVIFRTIVRRPVFVCWSTLVRWSICGISSAIGVAPTVRWRIVIATGARSYNSASAKRRWSLCSRDRRLAMICRRTQFTIASRFLYMLILSPNRPNGPFSRSRFFLARRTHVHSAISAVVTHSRHID